MVVFDDVIICECNQIDVTLSFCDKMLDMLVHDWLLKVCLRLMLYYIWSGWELMVRSASC